MSDEARLAALLERAFRTDPARDANRAIDDVRGFWGRGGPSFSYEIPLTGNRGWVYLRDSAIPSLVRYLRSKRMSVDNCRPVFLAIFFDDRLHFVGAEEFFAYFREVEEMSLEALRDRAKEWENETQ